MDFIQHVYITIVITNHPSSKVHYTTALASNTNNSRLQQPVNPSTEIQLIIGISVRQISSQYPCEVSINQTQILFVQLGDV